MKSLLMFVFFCINQILHYKLEVKNPYRNDDLLNSDISISLDK